MQHIAVVIFVRVWVGVVHVVFRHSSQASGFVFTVSHLNKFSKHHPEVISLEFGNYFLASWLKWCSAGGAEKDNCVF
jgi:uncharacterized protein YqiB (DUF1249 family)